MMMMILFILHANVPLHNAVVGAVFDVFVVTLAPVLICMYISTDTGHMRRARAVLQS